MSLPPRASRTAARRALVVAGAFAVAAALLTFDGVHAQVVRWMAAAEPLFHAHPLSGRLLFVLLAAASAMVAFVSSTVIVPAAVYAWGTAQTAALLWSGWWLGGLATYALGRAMQRPMRRLFAHSELARRLRLQRRLPWLAVLVLQLALPSEVPGYLCGLLRVSLPVYASALAVAELPYAIGAVLAARGVVQGHAALLLALGAAAALAMLVAARLLQHDVAGRDAPRAGD